MAKGRKRKNVPREPNGRPKRERVADIKATVHRQRYAMGATPKNVDSANWESAVGRAFEWGFIDARQLEAAQCYMRLVNLYCHINGYKSPFPKSPELDADLRGRSPRDFPEDFCRHVTAEFQAADLALGDSGRRSKLEVLKLTRDDMDVIHYPAHQLNLLSAGLDALADFFKIPAKKAA